MRILGVLGRAAARGDKGVGRIEHLVCLREHGVGGTAERICLPDVDQGPNLVARLNLGNSQHRPLARINLRLLHKASQESHARDLEHSHESHERYGVLKREVVLACPRLH